MKIAACNLSLVPLRSEASHRSEMVSQVRFGECFEILEEQEDFVKINLIDVPYQGWVQRGQFASCLPSYVVDHQLVDTSGAMAKSQNYTVHLSHGTIIKNNFITIGKENYTVDGNLRTPSLLNFDTEFSKLIEYYNNAPYQWGGRSISGIDCSGLSQVIFSHFGIPLRRDAWQQAQQGETVDFISEINPGDLAFFDNAAGKITHVGIMINKETILHASSRVRIDRMDDEGIYNSELQKYTHKLRIIKRFF